MLLIDKAQMFFYKFPSPMFNKSQPKTRKNTTPRTISAINLLGIVREDDGDNVVFYDGWDPQKRGEKIMKEFFVKGLQYVVPFLFESTRIKNVIIRTQRSLSCRTFAIENRTWCSVNIIVEWHDKRLY